MNTDLLIRNISIEYVNADLLVYINRKAKYKISFLDGSDYFVFDVQNAPKMKYKQKGKESLYYNNKDELIGDIKIKGFFMN